MKTKTTEQKLRQLTLRNRKTIADWSKERSIFVSQIKELEREKNDLEIEAAELQRERDRLRMEIGGLKEDLALANS